MGGVISVWAMSGDEVEAGGVIFGMGYREHGARHRGNGGRRGGERKWGEELGQDFRIKRILGHAADSAATGGGRLGVPLASCFDRWLWGACVWASGLYAGGDEKTILDRRAGAGFFC